MKHSKHLNLLTILFFSCLSLLTLLLFSEYRFFCNEAQKIIALKEQYHEHVERLKKSVDTSNENILCEHELAENDCCGDPQDFIVINRESEHLKQSALDYFKEQQLDELLTRIDVQDMQDYNKQVIAPKKQSPPQKITKKSKKTGSKRKKTIKRRADMSMKWPINKKNFWISSLFGPRKMKNGKWKFHRGLDMASVKGTKVLAAYAGVVETACYQAGYGNTIVIRHNNKYKSRYAHLSKICVKKGQRVQQGKYIGDVGDTGFTLASGKDASHLHFEVYDRGKQINPLQVLPRI